MFYLAAHAGVVLMLNEQSNLLTPQAVSGYADNNSMLQISYRLVGPCRE